MVVGVLVAIVLTTGLIGYSLFSGTQPGVATQPEQASQQEVTSEQQTQQVAKNQQQPSQQAATNQQQPSQQATTDDLQRLIDSLNQDRETPITTVGDTPARGQIIIRPNATPANTNTEAQALKAAVNYYTAAERGDYATTYSLLSKADKRNYSSARWSLANQRLDTAAGDYVINAVKEVPGAPNRVRVNVTVHRRDGSSFDRVTSFVYEDGAWRHDLSAEEYSMFNSVL